MRLLQCPCYHIDLWIKVEMVEVVTEVIRSTEFPHRIYMSHDR